MIADIEVLNIVQSVLQESVDMNTIKGCSTKRRSCAHANMPCTELYGCSESDECHNTEDSINISDLGGIDNEDRGQ